MIASLMMYLRPELAEANDRLWVLIRDRLLAQGMNCPTKLDNSSDEFFVWTHPSLVLSQTCGMPYRLLLHDRVALVGTPDYGLEDCPPGYYRSAIVVRADDTRKGLNDFRNSVFAFNQTISQSGFAAPFALCRTLGFWFDRTVQSGQHLASARMVAQGQADIASLDAVTWRLIQRYEPFAADLRVIAWTEPTPGLPFVTAAKNDVPLMRDAIRDALNCLTENDRNLLGIRDLVLLDKSAYLAVENPPSEIIGPLPAQP
jgi:ABC-type phosphate/phosphonate transport system substrate-binding protein